MTERTSRPSHSFRSVALGLLVLFVAAAAVAIAGYVVFLRYDRVAASHLPSDTSVAVRIDVEQAVFYEPVRRYLLPLLQGRAGAEDAAFWRALDDSAGLRRRDLREVVGGVGPTPDDWVIILNGLFPQEDTIRKLQSFLGSDWGQADGALLHRTSGIALAQAEDGALILASNLARALRARRPDPGAPKLPTTPTLSAIASARALRAVVQPPWSLAVPELAELRTLHTIAVVVRPKDPLAVQVRFTPGPDASDTEGTARVRRLLAGLKRWVHETPGEDLAGERAVLERVEILTEDGETVAVASWDRLELERAAQSAAQALRGWMAGLAPPRG